jgi:hypothetical protein
MRHVRQGSAGDFQNIKARFGNLSGISIQKILENDREKEFTKE